MPQTRRGFLSGLAAAPWVVPATVRGANDRITYGVIGTGSRGRYLNRKFQQLGAQCVALCDVYDQHLQLAVKESPPGVKTYVDYQELLAQPGIDVVVLAGPDHHHCPMLLASLKAGKDVYAEKPLSYCLAESEQMVKAVDASDRIVQVGMQRRSAPVILRARRLVQEGLLGRVTQVKATWNWNVARPLDNSPLPGKLDWERFLGPAPRRPLEPMRYRRWRCFLDYAGGNMTDQGTHLMDVVQWFTEAGPPRSAMAHGFVAKMKGAEHPDVFTAVFDYGSFVAVWSLNYCNDYQDGWSITFMGDEGTLELDESGFRLYAEPWKDHREPVYVAREPVPVEPHIQNFLDCVRTRQQPNCTVRIAAEAVAGPHLANLALFHGKKITLEEAMRSVWAEKPFAGVASAG